MVSYRVIVSPRALAQLDDYIAYVHYTLLNPIAAKSILNDAKKTREMLSKVAGSLKLCDHPTLHKLGYRAIKFEKHDYAMLYRTEGKTAYVDGIYHLMQDYENLFAAEL
jgi:5-deoxy-D-glucuronate isomerase